MNVRPLPLSISAAALLAGGILLGSQSFATRAPDAQDKQPAGGTKEAQDEMPGMDPAMMQRMMELATPGPEHEEFAAQVGTLKTTYKMRFADEMPWMETPGVIEGKTLLGGRYLMQTHKFEMMGMPMEGITLMGFDKEAGEYISLWMDSMSTWWITSHGKKDAAGALMMSGEMKDVAGKRPFRMKRVKQKDGAYDHEMYDTIGGKEVLVMTYTLKPAAR